jgi:hypothetical protein
MDSSVRRRAASASPRRAPKGVIRRARVLRGGVLLLVALSGGVAGAAVVVRNFMTAEVIRQEPCLRVVHGTDHAAYPSGFPSVVLSTDDVANPVGVPIRRELITLRGVKPTRTVLGDALRIRNRCTTAVTVTLSATAHDTLPAIEGEWNDLGLRAYLSIASTAAPATDLLAPLTPAAAIARGRSLGDPTVVASWNQTPVRVTASTGGVGTVSSTSTGSVTIPAGQDIQVALVTDAGSNATASDGVIRLTLTAVST